MRRTKRERNVLPPIGDFSSLQITKDDCDDHVDSDDEIHLDIRQSKSAPASPRISRDREMISLDSKNLRATSPSVPRKSQVKTENKMATRKQIYQAKSDTNIKGATERQYFGNMRIEIGTPAPGFHTSLDVNVDADDLNIDGGDMTFPAIKVDSCADRKASIVADSLCDTHTLSPQRINRNVNIRKASSAGNLAKQKQPSFKSVHNTTMEPDYISVSQIPVTLSRSENDIYGTMTQEDVSFRCLATDSESHSDYSSEETLLSGNEQFNIKDNPSNKSRCRNRKYNKDVMNRFPPVNNREGSKCKTEGSICKSFNVADRSSCMSNASTDSATSCSSPDVGLSPGTRRRIRETPFEVPVHSLHTPVPPRSPSPRRRLNNKWVVQDDAKEDASSSVSPNVCKKPIRLLPIEYDENK